MGYAVLPCQGHTPARRAGQGDDRRPLHCSTSHAHPDPIFIRRFLFFTCSSANFQSGLYNIPALPLGIGASTAHKCIQPLFMTCHVLCSPPAIWCRKHIAIWLLFRGDCLCQQGREFGIGNGGFTLRSNRVLPNRL